MADKTGIEWTDATWNPLRGCSRVSAGCQHCYAERVAARFSGPRQPYEGLIHPKTGGWNGQIKLVPEALQIPYRWARPRRIFVNSMTDLFHEAVPFEYIAAVFWVMSVTTRHTYQILTKRPARMLEFFAWLLDYGCERDVLNSDLWPLHHQHAGWRMGDAIYNASHTIPELAAIPWIPQHNKHRGGYDNCGPGWPYQNVWLGVSVEDQATADERIPLLLQCPAAVRWISAEPLLGAVDLRRITTPGLKVLGQADTRWIDALTGTQYNENHIFKGELPGDKRIDWVVSGGESGPGARPMHPDWARSLRNQCAAAGVPFLFKQWGEWGPVIYREPDGTRLLAMSSTKNETVLGDPRKPSSWVNMRRFGKKLSGRVLDGLLHDDYPTESPFQKRRTTT